MGIFGSKPFAALNGTLARLSDIRPIDRAAPHQPLANDVWLTVEQGMGADLAVSGGPGGLTLDLKTISRSDWLSLSFTIPIKTVQQGRFLVLIVRTISEGFISYRPCLRHLLEKDGYEDRFCNEYIVSAGGEEEQLAFIDIEPDLLAQTRATEMHLFFQGTKFRVSLPNIELALIE